MEVQQQRSNSSHGGGSMTTFVAPICDCGEFAVLRTATTVKKLWEGGNFGVSKV